MGSSQTKAIVFLFICLSIFCLSKEIYGNPIDLPYTSYSFKSIADTYKLALVNFLGTMIPKEMPFQVKIDS